MAGLSNVNDTPVADRLDWLTLTKAALIFAVTAAAYFVARSPGLDDYDSVQFAMGVNAFNLCEHQPHPPGYPLFIFLGRVARAILGTNTETSLYLVSSLGGGLFIAAWFLIVRLQFSERLAWWVTASLAVTPAVWMTATKVLTDATAAGFLSAELAAAVYFSQRKNLAALFFASLFGAAAAGTRPQLILVVAVVLGIALMRGRAGWRASMLGIGVFFAGCLMWLLPMWYSQARLRPDMPAWLVCPKLLLGQWQWRLDRPNTFVGAGDWSPRYLATRLAEHILGWFGIGFGFIASPLALVIGAALLILGLFAYARARRRQDTQFWRFHAPWAVLHVAIIFISLDGKQRYYLVIFPLLLVALIRGFLRLPSPRNLTGSIVPALLLYITIPAAIENHREEAPPIRLVQFLDRLCPPAQRPNVALLFTNARRHVEWYAPEYRTFREIPSPSELPTVLQNAPAVYTDDPHVALPPGWRRVPMAVFRRSVIIHAKYHFLTLFFVERHS